MTRIIKIGMDVHSTNYTLCALEPVIGADNRVFANIKVTPDCKNILMFIENLKQQLGSSDDYLIECGYEAGCLGFSLRNKLVSAGIKCTILAPTTMLAPQGKRIKTDKRDALMIAQCLAHGGYKAVYIPDEEDDAVKEYIRMRDDHRIALKKIKQQICAFCLRHGCHFEKSKWTSSHLAWLNKLELSSAYREILDEYLLSYHALTDKIMRFEQRIAEFADCGKYRQKVQRLCCFLGVKTHTALSLITETGDFERFAKGNKYAAYLGLLPSEDSSAVKISRGGISKAGNSHLRCILTEAAQSICRGKVGYKSKELRSRQYGNAAEVIAYADKANYRLRKKYYKMIFKQKKHNVAVTAIARELACFVWGMMTNNIDFKTA